MNLVCALAALTVDGFVDRGTYQLHFESIGQGQPTVAIPGGPGFSGRAVWSYGYEMADAGRTILFDQLGTGQSRMKSGAKANLSLERTISDLEALRVHLGFKKWTVFGQSWGAVVAVAYAAKHPEKVDRLVLASIPGFRMSDYQVLTTNLMIKVGDSQFANLYSKAREAATPREGAAIQVFGLLPYYFLDPELGSMLSGRARPEMFDGNTFLDLYDELTDTTFSWIKRDIRKWKGQALIIQGHQDPCGAAMAYELAAFLPGSQLRMIDGAGHFTFIERPEVFFPAVRKFLRLREAPHYRYMTGSAIDAWRAKRLGAGWPFGFKP